jgi:pseudolysin/vibriolysin
VKRGSQPTVSSYDHRSTGASNSETVTITRGIYDLDDVIAGDWYVTLQGYSAAAGVSLTASYQ